VRQPAARDLIGYTVTIRTSHRALDDYLARLYAAFPESMSSEHRYEVLSDDDRFRLEFDGDVVGHADAPEGLVPTLVMHCNRVAASATAHALVHAGGVQLGDVAVMLPARMESGKTTLTTGLVRAGFRYLTDEAVAIDRNSLEAVPYPKPMSLDPGAWHLFPELEPEEPFGTDAYKATQWQVPPAAIRQDALGTRCRIGFVIFPEYDENASTALLPLSRAEALVELTKNTFRFDQEGRPTLDVLAAVVKDAHCFRLPNSSLDDAIACIQDVTGTLPSR
jgi:hypothetical protein